MGLKQSGTENGAKILKVGQRHAMKKAQCPIRRASRKEGSSVFLASTRLTSEAGPPSAVSFLLLLFSVFFFFF